MALKDWKKYERRGEYPRLDNRKKNLIIFLLASFEKKDYPWKVELEKNQKFTIEKIFTSTKGEAMKVITYLKRKY